MVSLVLIEDIASLPEGSVVLIMDLAFSLTVFTIALVLFCMKAGRRKWGWFFTIFGFGVVRTYPDIHINMTMNSRRGTEGKEWFIVLPNIFGEKWRAEPYL